MERHHILWKAGDHLDGGLSANAAIEEITTDKVFVETPGLGDGIAEEHDAGKFARGQKFRVGVGVVLQVVRISFALLRVQVLNLEDGFEMLLHPLEAFTQLGILLIRGGREGVRARDGIGERKIRLHLVHELIDERGVERSALHAGKCHLGILLDRLAGAHEAGDGHGGRFDQLKHAGSELFGVLLAEHCAGGVLWLRRS